MYSASLEEEREGKDLDPSCIHISMRLSRYQEKKASQGSTFYMPRNDDSPSGPSLNAVRFARAPCAHQPTRLNGPRHDLSTPSSTPRITASRAAFGPPDNNSAPSRERDILQLVHEHSILHRARITHPTLWLANPESRSYRRALSCSATLLIAVRAAAVPARRPKTAPDVSPLPPG